MARGASALDHEEALLRADLAVAGAGAAGFRAGAGLGARSVARVAQAGDVDGDFLRLAVESVLQRDFHVVAQIGATLRRALATATAHEFAEHAFEDVGKAAEILWPAAATLLERGVAEAVIGGALLRVLEAFIRLADRLEFGFVVLAPVILVRVIFHRELAVRRLQSRVVDGAFDLQQLVIIGFGTHLGPPPPSRRLQSV